MSANAIADALRRAPLLTHQTFALTTFPVAADLTVAPRVFYNPATTLTLRRTPILARNFIQLDSDLPLRQAWEAVMRLI